MTKMVELNENNDENEGAFSVPNVIEHCRPSILIYTDGLEFDNRRNNGMSLSIFLREIFELGQPHAPPLLTLAHRGQARASQAWISNSPRMVFPIQQYFRFDSAAVPVTRQNYDQIWLFGFAPNATDGLSDSENRVIIDFMNSGGGVFATGDHSSIGYGIAGRLPRIRKMRNWEGSPNGTPMGTEGLGGYWTQPTASNPLTSTYRAGANDRRDTMSDPGGVSGYQFDDQGDNTAQRIYPYYQTLMISGQPGNWISKPHPLLKNRMSSSDRTAYGPTFGRQNITATAWSVASPYTHDISFLPDHAHEGECFEVSQRGGNEAWFKYDNGTSYSEFGYNFVEFGADPLNANVREPATIVAFSVAGGRAVATGSNQVPGIWKPPVNPRIFGAISAYDGQVVAPYLTVPGYSTTQSPGRIVCDATWHHFINTNLSGEGTGREPGLYLRHPTTGALLETRELSQILRYYKNILLWLMPANRSLCTLWTNLLSFRLNPHIMHELTEHIAFKDAYDIVISGRLLMSYIDNADDVISSEELAKSILIHGDQWRQFAPFLDIGHPTPAPVEAADILAYAYGRALAAHFKRFPDTIKLSESVATETKSDHKKSETQMASAFYAGCKEGLDIVISQTDKRLKLLKAMKKQPVTAVKVKKSGGKKTKR